MVSKRSKLTLVREMPRERLNALGPAALTVVELVAILLGTGDTRTDVLELSEKLVSECNGSLRELSKLPPGLLAKTGGIGFAKAARISAALELARRLSAEERQELFRVRSPGDVFRCCGPYLRDLLVEEFHVLALDTQNRVMRDILITRGILNGSLVHPREVFRAAIAAAAAGVIMVHNHPGGDPAPSDEDKVVTRQLVKAGLVLNIPVYDHVVVGGDSYYSFAEAGLL